MSKTAVVIALLWTGSAWGYVRSTTTQGTPLRWIGTNCIPVVINTAGSDDVTDGSAVQAAKDALSAWREATKHCSYIRFNVTERADAKPGFSTTAPNEVAVVWQESGWPHDKTAQAVTTVFFVEKPGGPNDGKILDADIEINGELFKFSTTGDPQAVDVQNALMQEIGHVLGLDANCDQGFGAQPPKDHTGADAPKCADVTSSTDPEDVKLREATMWPFADPGETKKRTLEADDIAGICAIYPIADDPGCHPVSAVDGGPLADAGVARDARVGDGGAGVSQGDGCGCQIGAVEPPLGPALALVGLLVMLIGRTRRAADR